MRPPDNSRRYVVLALSMALAAVFTYAGIDKIRDPLQFADTSLASLSFRRRLSTCSRWVCRHLKSRCGLLLLGPRTRRVGAFAVAVVS